MFAGKPIIGIAGGIGSGKSFVASLFEELGGLVLSADEEVREAYRAPQVKETLRQWWGDSVFTADRQIDRKAVARKIFNDDAERRKLEGLLHPIVLRRRDEKMNAEANNPQVKAFIWDTPLLFEAGLNQQCDALVFVDSPLKMRVLRLAAGRGWDEAELLRREKLQMPLDRKRELSDDVICNTADAEFARGQVREVFGKILSRVAAG